MREHGGFEHNRQSLRIVEELEEKYPGFRGLNLSWEVREGLIKHQITYDQPGPAQRLFGQVTFAGGADANLADALIYNSHDSDDGLVPPFVRKETNARGAPFCRCFALSAQGLWRVAA